MTFQSKAPPTCLVQPPKGKVLVIAPHPDDETMGVGGTLLHHHSQGDSITALFVCNGIQGDPEAWFPRDRIVSMRKQEAENAAQILGIEELRFLDYPDNLSDADIHVFEGLPSDPDEARRALAKGFAEKLSGIISDEKFTILYYPWDGELNPDHWLIGQGVRHLMEAQPELQAKVSFLGYDVWTACAPDLVIDTSDVMAKKLLAVHCYHSQELYVDYAHCVAGLDAYRSLFLPRGATYGEAFVGRYLSEGAP